MRLTVRPTPEEASIYLANLIRDRITSFAPTPERPFVLGLPTGSSPEKIYAYLVEFYRAGKLSFKNVITFNMDEYVSLPASHPQSYHTFMYTHLFSHVDILPQNVHILDGTASDLEAECAAYERLLTLHPIRLFLTGVGQNGHIAFNEPYTPPTSLTRIAHLTPSTIAANARFFSSASSVPTRALSVGIATILAAGEIVVIATGANKADAVKMGVEGPMGARWPVSWLQGHGKVEIVVDEGGAGRGLGWETIEYFKNLENAEVDARAIGNVQMKPKPKL